ncbi:ubiquitin carboxyl-terminal hydrolase [Hamiltosporidium magnivora]|uniref:Ubiquitin carboxyl-terminal hydrolase n=1 Tax=Hamiltosporidium magnivora TaxID=148818 RepID=A0A4Q9KX67_9MICR|nr:ubiquitin carboxyl-terminal hydrolase [Hamiltosporidium magnivora]
MTQRKQKLVLLTLITLLSFFSGFLTGFLVHENYFNDSNSPKDLSNEETDTFEFIDETKDKEIKSIRENADICPLKNSGVMCYFNSLIQCMYSLKELKNIFLSEDSSNANSGVKKIFKDLFIKMGKKDLSIDTKNIIQNILAINSSQEFKNINKHQDIHALYVFLIDNCLFNGNSINEIDSKEKFDEAAKDSNISKLYLCLEKTHYFVAENRTSTKFEIWNAIIACAKTFDYQMIIDQYFKKEYITEESAENKNVLVNIEIEAKMIRFPNVLVVHSFCYSEDFFFPADIKDIKIENEKYSLVSAGCHAGNTESGHYITIRRVEGNEWAIINDNSISYYKTRNVLNFLRKHRFKPTLAFFEKIKV